MRYAWATDIHLDHLGDTPTRVIEFAEKLIQNDPTGVFLTGDISTSRRVIEHLSILESVVRRPIYFVLGNHDYYYGNIVDVRKQMHEINNISQHLKYMSVVPYASLTKSTAVVGHDGWYDALNGDWKSSGVVMNDWYMIWDFASGAVQVPTLYSSAQSNVNVSYVVEKARSLAHEGATHIMNGIKAAVRHHKNIIILTHFPPFVEAHHNEGRLSDSSYHPWYTSKMMGDMLFSASKAYPNNTFTVLCGHSHGKFSGAITQNLHVHVGGSVYNAPEPQQQIEVP